MQSVPEVRNWRPLRLSAVASLILLSFQAWTGDFERLPHQHIQHERQPVRRRVLPGNVGQGLFLLWHGMMDFLVLLSTIGVLAVSLRYHRRSVKIAAVLDLFFVIVAGLGGYLFVLSGFLAGGNSMQMGGAFLGAYAMYSLALYYSK